MFCCQQPGWTFQAKDQTPQEMKMTNLMDRMTRMEADMVTKEEMMRRMKDDLETKDQRITNLEAVINDKDAKMYKLEEEMKSLTGNVNVTEAEDTFAFQCAWKDRWRHHHLRQTDV